MVLVVGCFCLMVLVVCGRWGIPYNSLFDFHQIWWCLMVLLVLVVFAVLVVLVVVCLCGFGGFGDFW